MSGSFYRAFEDRHRGSRDLIKLRQQVYLPFIYPLKELRPGYPILDLGCGRGEWLELLSEQGYEAEGVDIDDTMLSACRDLGLTVNTSDAIDFIKRLPDASRLAISGFHIAEHIPFGKLNELVFEALRVLVPGGLLILETPNPENIVVGSCSFYLDPTHERPIPPLLLSFVPEYVGFHRTKILRLQQSPDLLSNPSPSLLSILNGVSPDYAVIAQKAGPAGLLEAFDPAFEVEYGVTLEALAARYQQGAEARITDAESCAAQAKTYMAETASLAVEIRNHAAKAEAQAAQAEARAVAAEIRAVEVETRITDLLNSTSWRLTSPLRRSKETFRYFKISRLRPRSRVMLQHAMLYVRRRPWLKAKLLQLVNRFPVLKSKLLKLSTVTFVSPPASSPATPPELAQLPPRARKIYIDLQSAIADRKRAS